MEGRRIDISATQVIASLLAAVTGAIAASTLGVAGTIIGTAVMSVASTAIAGLYKHYVARSRERLRKAAEAARASERAAAFRSRHGTIAGAHAATRTTAANAADDADKTQVFPAVAATQHRWQEDDRANGVGRAGDAIRTAGGLPGDATRTVGEAAGATGAELAGAVWESDGDVAGNAGQPAGGGDESGPDDGNGAGHAKQAPARPLWRRPLAMAGIAFGIFLLAIAAITAIEAVAGKPLDALVGGKHTSGTTIGNLVGGNAAQATSHHSGPTPLPSPSSTPTPSPSTTPSVSPSPTASPTPTPTPSGTPSPTPTTGGTAGATPSG